MKGLKALLWKDGRLFRSGAGLAALILPLALLCLLRLGMADTLRQAYVEPFPIAVRDMDETVMSRFLVDQMEQVELFSQVVRVKGESDQALLDRGCAAVLTIPKDFFYTMYYMDNGLVEVSLNEEMPLEAALLRAMFVSIMDIISADQSATGAVFRFCYGDLSDGETAQLWEASSQRIIADALGRHRVFDQVQEADDLQSTLEGRLLGCTLSLICLFFPLAAVKTLPQELSSGVLPRYLAAGGKKWAFLLSKFLVGLLLALPSLLLVLAVFPPERPGMVLLLGALLYLCGFALQLTVSALAGEASAAQRWGALALLLSLVLGGALYPVQLLPGFAQALGELTLPRWAIRGVGIVTAGAGPGELLAALFPAWGIALALITLWLWRSRGGEKSRRMAVPLEAVAAEPAQAPRRAPALLPMMAQKFKAMSGGAVGLMSLLIVVALCGGVAAASLRGNVDALRLGVTLPDSDPAAQELVDWLGEQEGLEVLTVEEDAGQKLLAQGKIEGLLRINAGYSDALTGEGAMPLNYESGTGTSSGLAVREIVAGQVAAQRARLRALADARERLGRALSAEEREGLLREIEAQREALGPLYEINGSSGADLGERLFVPGQLSFALLAVLLMALTWAAWTGEPDARMVESRLASLPGGLALSYGTEVAALLAVCLLTGACALFPGREVRGMDWLALAVYSLCVTGAALALARLGAAERMDALAPFAALLTCLAGGCFGEVGSISLLTPQGLALHAAAGSLLALVALLLIAAVLFWLGAPRRAR